MLVVEEEDNKFLLLDTVSGVKKFNTERNEEQFIKEQLIKMIIQLDLQRLKEFGFVDIVLSENSGNDYYFKLRGNYTEEDEDDDELTPDHYGLG